MRALTPEETARATQILQRLELNIPAESLNRIDLNGLEDANDQIDICPTCEGKPNCKRIHFTVEDGKLISTSDHCRKSIAYMKRTKTAQLIAAANVPRRYRGIRAEHYNTNRNAKAIDAAEQAILDDTSVYFYGDVGTGKTMLAAIIANERAERTKYSLFNNTANLLDEIRVTFNQTNSNANDYLMRYVTTDCLIMDDIGAEKTTDWTMETLFKIYNARYENMAQNVFTSNLTPDELRRHIGARVARRIFDGTKIIELH